MQFGVAVIAVKSICSPLSCFKSSCSFIQLITIYSHCCTPPHYPPPHTNVGSTKTGMVSVLFIASTTELSTLPAVE